MKKTLLALGLAVIASSSFAYDGQIDGGFTYFDHDSNIVDSNGLFNLQGTLYLGSVNPKNGPLNEAAFLGHNSNVYAKYSYEYLDTKTVDVSDYFSVSSPLAGKVEDDSHHISLGAEYFFEQFYFNGEVGYKEEKEEAKAAGISASEDYDTTTYRALVGFLPVTNLLLAAGIDGYKGDGDDEDNRFAVKAKYVAPLNNGQYINLEADGAFGDVDSATIGADYYFDQAFSIGAAYNIEDNGNDDIDFFAIRSKYFVNPNLAVGGQVGFGDDVQAFNINATFRF